MLQDLLQDLRYTARTIRRSPAFAIAAILSLGIGIGANTAIFSIVNALLVRRLPVFLPEQMSYLTRTGAIAEARSTSVNTRFSYQGFLRYQDAVAAHHMSLAAMTPATRMQVSVNRPGTSGAPGTPGTQSPQSSAGGGDDTELILAELVTGNWFDILGIGSQRGRVFTADDDRLDGAGQVAVLSDGFWSRRFGRDPSAVGSTLRLNGQPLTIVGIAAPGFQGFIVGDPIDVWAPTSMQQQVRYNSNAEVTDAEPLKPWRAQDGIAWLTVVARVRPPETRAGISALLDTAFRHDIEARAAGVRNPLQRAYLLRAHARLVDGSRGMSDVRNQFGRAVLVLMATVVLVLLVTCANLANLLMARSAARSRELAVRLSLGAGRWRLIRQMLTETLVVGFMGGAASLVLAPVGSAALLRMAADGPTPLPLDVSMSWQIVAFAIGLSVVTGIVFGLLPAIRFSRPTVGGSIQSGSRVVSSSTRMPIGRLLVVAQVALSFTLLVGATLFVRTLRNLLSINPGFQATHLVTARFDPRMAGYTPATMAALRERLLDGARAIPGSQLAAVAMCGTMANCHSISDIEVPGRQAGGGDDADVQEDYVSADYFPGLGMSILAGRNFSASDTTTTPRVAVVNESMARHFFGGVDPVGKHFKSINDIEIVGVVGDSRINGLREAPPRMAFYPFSQHPDRPIRNLYVRVNGDVTPAVHQLRSVIRNADRAIAVREVVTLGELEERSIAREHLVSNLTAAFGLLGVAVACLGLYGMLSYSVARRTSEIGIRLALGASRASVRWLILHETILLVVVGLAAGLTLTLPALRLVEALLYGLSTRDPLTLGMAAGILTAVAVLSGAVPAWRASRVDPIQALRVD